MKESILYNRPCEEVFETMYNLIEKCHRDNKFISSDDFLLLPMGNDHYTLFAPEGLFPKMAKKAHWDEYGPGIEKWRKEISENMYAFARIFRELRNDIDSQNKS